MSKFAHDLQLHMNAWVHDNGLRLRSRGTWRAWEPWTEGIHPDYRLLAESVSREDAVRLHRYASHPRSSQAFPFNLFLPFRQGRASLLSELVSSAVGEHLDVDEVRFEWVPPGHLLGEIKGERPVGRETATGVDVVLWARLSSGQRAVVLTEVKLSEEGFTPCNGRTSAGNRRQDVCESARLFLQDPASCYLRRPVRKQRDRRYWEIFSVSAGSVHAAFPGVDLNGECPFAYNMQQPMRNLAIARALEQESSVAQAWFALCAHDENPDVAQHWEEWRGLLRDSSKAPMIPASEVVQVGEAAGLTDWAQWMRGRYRLPEVSR